ncbi:MAG: hypothetical protein ABIQ01_12870 [Pseudolysinimonas sp.]
MSTGRAVDVGGIACQEHTPVTKSLGVSALYLESGDPRWVPQHQLRGAGILIDDQLQHGEIEVAVLEVGREHDEQPPCRGRSQGEEEHQPSGRDVRMDAPLLQPINFEVGYREHLRKPRSRERDAGQNTGRTVRTVTSDDVVGLEALAASCRLNVKANAFGVLRQADERRVALDTDPVLLEVLQENLLGPSLRQEKQERVSRPAFGAIEERQRDVPSPVHFDHAGRVAVGNEQVCDPRSFQDLQRPGLDRQSAGFVHRRRRSIDDAKRNPSGEQLDRKRQTRRSSADDRHRWPRIAHGRDDTTGTSSFFSRFSTRRSISSRT